MKKIILLISIFLFLFLNNVQAYGPYNAVALKVIDGDTIRLEVEVWPTIAAHVDLRLLGIDTPEIYRPNCTKEKELGLKAQAFVVELLKLDALVIINKIKEDKFSGRVDGILIAEGRNVGDALLKAGLAKEWNGVGPKPNWCL